MAAGDEDDTLPAESRAELRELTANPAFCRAVSAYRKYSDKYDVPYLGGSSKDGTTIYLDKDFAKSVSQGKVKYRGNPFDPRDALKVHEAYEGAAIRQLGWSYDKAHQLASVAESLKVKAMGLDWAKYNAALDPFIKREEKGGIEMPPDLLETPYKGTPFEKDFK